MPANHPPNPLPCGCRAMMRLDTMTGKSIYIRYCPLHSAAEDLLKALEAFMDMWNSGDSSRSSKRAQQRRADMWDLANAAVLKARPTKEKKAQTEENRAV